ncbi:MAG: hypothetical protein JO000_01820 [Alphaproteobacteria bacterium]|nr:hypothetical protein [Alphaproteobacteria bacterium]
MPKHGSTEPARSSAFQPICGGAAIIIILSGLTVPPFDSPARAGALAYSAAACQHKAGDMLYVAVGRHVFRQPAGNLEYVHGVSLETAAGLPIPPRLSDPEGCPDHPLRGVGFKFAPFADVESREPRNADIGIAIQLIEIDFSSWWDTYERYALAGGNGCGPHDRIGPEAVPGMIVCWSTTNGPVRASFAAIVDSQSYRAPHERPLAVLCNSDQSSQGDDYLCEISYRLDGNVGVWYEFSLSLIPLSGIIDFDKELRRRLAAAEIADYGWPTLSVSRPHASER